MDKRFWFYNDWEYTPRQECRTMFDWFRMNFKGSDEYGHHTFVVPMGKGRAVVVAYRAGYKGLRKCEFCVLSRQQTLDFQQELYYVQTYWNIECLDDVYDLSNEEWLEALNG